MKWLEKTDKNGTQYWGDDTCQRCGGRGGAEAWRFTGYTCYECGGMGTSKPHFHKVYTPEYAEILRKKQEVREAKRMAEMTAKRTAEASEKNAKFMENFFGLSSVAMITENSYGITETLKEEGCHFIPKLTAWVAKETTRQHITISIPAITLFNEYGELEFADYDVVKAYIDLMKLSQSTTTYVGTVGERLTLNLTVSNVYKFVGQAYGRPWMTETTFINKMVDSEGNVFVWKTTSGSLTGNVTLKATVKEHTEYNGEKQTILTRCKVS